MQQAEQTIDAIDPESDQIVQYLTFTLSEKIYGLDLLKVKEIIEYGELTEVPLTPDFIPGVISLRGSVVPVIDLNQRFSGEPISVSKRTSIVILEVQSDDLNIEIGITVDLVNEVLDVHLSEVEPSPAMGGQIKTDFISGMARVDGKFLVLLAMDKLLSIDELSLVGSIGAEKQ